MKDKERNELLMLDGAIKDRFSTLIANAGKVIAGITLLIAILVTFTDVAFSDIRSESFTTTFIIMLISAYLMYFSLEDAGEREGEESEEYRTANKRYIATKAKITPDRIEELRGFCLDYTKKELEYRQAAFLSERGYTTKELMAFEGGESFPAEATRVFKRAKRLSAIRLTPSVLLSPSRKAGFGDALDPRGKKLFGALTSLIPSTLCMIFTVSIILTAKENMTLSTVIDSLIKLSALPIVGLKGLLDGYSYTRETKVDWLNTKTELLLEFLNTQ
jgi:hypothetical protein